MVKFTKEQIAIFDGRGAEVKFVRKKGKGVDTPEHVYAEVWDKALKTMMFEVEGEDHEAALKAASDKLKAMPKPKSVADQIADKDAEIARLNAALATKTAAAKGTQTRETANT